MSWTFERVAGPYNFTEGPVWNGEALLFSDIRSSRTYRFDPASGETTVFLENTQEGNGQTLDREGRLIQVQHKGRRVVRYETDGSLTVFADHFGDLRLNSPNDVVVDKLGRIWFTDPRYGDFRDDMELDHESVYRLDPQADGSFSITRITFDTTCPNGLIVTPEMDRLLLPRASMAKASCANCAPTPFWHDGTVGALRGAPQFLSPSRHRRHAPRRPGQHRRLRRLDAERAWPDDLRDGTQRPHPGDPSDAGQSDQLRFR